MTENWIDKMVPLQLREVQRRGRTILLPLLENTHYAEPFALGYLGAKDDEPLNTRRARYQAIAHLRLSCIIAGINQPERRLSYETGLADAELRAINILIEHKSMTLRSLANQKRAGACFADLESTLARSNPLSISSQVVRKTHVLDYLKFLMNDGDAVLSQYTVPDEEIERRRRAFEAISRCITRPKHVARRSRSRFSRNELRILESFLEKYDPIDVWSKPTTAIRNSVMFDLQFYGGLRRSEVLALKWSDIFPGRGSNYPPQIKISARRNDPGDPRRRPPAAKTGSGVVTLPNSVFARLDLSWRFAWDEIEERAYELGCEQNMEHNFVFVTTAEARKDAFGSPLTLSGFDNASRALFASCGIEESDLSSHALRHLCAMRYVRRRRQMGHGNHEIRKGMREFFRWSLTSTMPDYYAAVEDHTHIYAEMLADKEFRLEC